MYARWMDRDELPADAQQAITARNGRTFATFPAAVVVPIVNRREQLLLLESKRRRGCWEPVNGAVERGETLLAAAMREVREEAGPDVRVRPLGVVHAETFAYDAHVARMISVVYVMRYEGGRVAPGDDMRGSRVRWAGLREIDADALQLIPPLDHAWLRRRAIDSCRLWEADPPALLQADMQGARRR
jgi:8-oxo-dGTP pyrophosphatase MutT (NUDIX family)